YLNTLYLYLLPDSGTWILYRIPSVIAGVTSVVLAASIARRAGEVGAASAAVLVGTSFLMILLASEARGYAAAIAFALLAVWAADRYLATDRRVWGALV